MISVKENSKCPVCREFLAEVCVSRRTSEHVGHSVGASPKQVVSEKIDWRIRERFECGFVRVSMNGRTTPELSCSNATAVALELRERLLREVENDG